MRPFILGFCLLVACGPASSDPAETDSMHADDPGDGSTSTAEVPTSSDGSDDSTSSADTTTGGDGSDDADYVAGSRLTPVLHANAEGETRFVYWHDTELGTDCAFVETAEGFACLPLLSWGPDGFTDPQCSEHAVVQHSCGEVPELGRYYEESCGVRSLARRGAAVETIYRRDTDGTCVEWPNVAGYRLEAMAPSMAVQASRTLHAVDASLGRWEYAGDDGSTQWGGPVRLDDEQDCSVEVSGSGAGCLASLTSLAPNLHRVASCDTEGLVPDWSDDGCPAPSFARDFHDGLWTVTEPLDRDEVWVGYDAETCTPLADQSSQYDVYAVRAFEAADAPTVEIQTQGTGRLRLRVPHAADGERIAASDYRWQDTELDFLCGFSEDDHGQTRCVPMSFTAADYFSDASCSTRLLSGPFVRVGDWRTLHDYDACDRRLVGAARVEATYEGDVYRRDGEGGCEALSQPESYGPFFTLDLHPPDALAPMEELR